MFYQFDIWTLETRCLCLKNLSETRKKYVRLPNEKIHN